MPVTNKAPTTRCHGLTESNMPYPSRPRLIRHAKASCPDFGGKQQLGASGVAANTDLWGCALAGWLVARSSALLPRPVGAGRGRAHSGRRFASEPESLHAACVCAPTGGAQTHAPVGYARSGADAPGPPVLEESTVDSGGCVGSRRWSRPVTPRRRGGSVRSADGPSSGCRRPPSSTNGPCWPCCGRSGTAGTRRWRTAVLERTLVGSSR